MSQVTVAQASVTVKDVARRAGVAVATVSAAMSGTGRISSKQREHVRQIAREMGYQPRLAARLLRASTTGRLGLIMTDSSAPSDAADSGFTGPILLSFVKACERAGIGYHLEFLPVHAASGQGYDGPEQFRAGMVDGALVAGYLPPGPIREWFESRIDRHPWISLDEPGRNAVLHDTQEGVRRAVEYLAAKRHQRIAYIGSGVDYTVYKLGLKGFMQAVDAYGISTAGGAWVKLVDVLGGRQVRLQNDLAAANALLDTENRPTAVICQSVAAARVVVYAAMARGLQIPRDLSVVAYGTSIDAERSLPRLDCIEPDHAALVARAVEMLRARLRGEQVAQTELLVPPQLVQRDSVSSVG